MPEDREQVLAAITDWPTDPDLISYRRYLAGYLSDEDHAAVKARLIAEYEFYHKTVPTSRAWNLLEGERRLRERRGGVPGEEGAIERTLPAHERSIVAERARLLTAALTEPGAVRLAPLVVRAGEAAERHDADGWLWIAAVRRVQMDGQLTSRHADAFVLHVAKRLPRYEAEGVSMLRQAGERNLATSIQHGGRHYPVGMALLVAELVHMADDATGRWLVNYPEWNEQSDLGPDNKWEPGCWPMTDQDEAAVTDLADRWRQVVAPGEDGHLQVLHIACRGVRNEPDLGSLELAGIRRARDLGVVSEEFEWMVADLLSKSMIARELEADRALVAIRKRLACLAAIGDGPEVVTTPSSVVGASGEWRAVAAARDRRTALFQRRALRAAGEDEVADVMRVDLPEFRRRVNQALREWSIW